MTKPLLLAAALCAALALPAAFAQSSAASAAAVTDDALFRALGGQAGIDRIVDDFVPRLVADPRLSEFFKKARQEHLKAMLAQQFCQVSGGGCAYTGLPMKLAHQDMDISKGDFNALVEVLQASMDAQGVPFATQNQLLARLAPMHRDVVNVH
jgi:hemoglobin